MRRLLVTLSALLVLALAPAAEARTFTVRGAPAPGPARLDRVQVEAFGPASARTVVVLVPGTGGGAGSLAPLARDLATRARLRDVQVWAVDRREDALEDRRGFAGGDPERARAYYAGLRYRQVSARDAPYIADWGLAVAVRDLRRVVLRARAGGRRVVLGGHSRGASTALAYAAWDFGGRPGYADIDGLALIDGGLLGALAGGSPAPLRPAGARAELARIRAGALFSDPLGLGVPSAGPVLAELAALYARRAPDAPSALQSEPVVPAALKPPFPVTNAAFLGLLFDDAGPPAFAALRVHAGRLAPAGDPRPWISDELTPIGRFARTFAPQPVDATDWYFPQRLILDVAGANAMGRDRAANALGLRLWHTRAIDLPLYAFQTALTRGAVLAGARRLARRSEIARPTLVSGPATGHLDPILATPRRNACLRTMARWLRDRVHAR